ncbi:hypothetical protein [Bacillus sp. P14.5]|uniref:hypothetical protein n=1 Tax=Bacillus sp. P14.5 TaxID=1983400 RepID=UPI000DEBF24D|nr:hypothetical protein [Bacillus sp. P14.5]
MDKKIRNYMIGNYGMFFIKEDDIDRHIDFKVQHLIHDGSQVRELVNRQSRQMNNCRDVITGTIFAKRYSVLAMGFLNLMSQFEIILDTNPRHSGIKLTKNGCMNFIFPESALFLSVK